MTRADVAVGTERLASMFLTIRAAAPRSGVGLDVLRRLPSSAAFLLGFRLLGWGSAVASGGSALLRSGGSGQSPAAGPSPARRCRRRSGSLGV